MILRSEKMFNIKAYNTVTGILRRVLKLKKYDRKIKKYMRSRA